MSMSKTMRQKPASAGRGAVDRGEAPVRACRDEASGGTNGMKILKVE